MPGFDGTGPMGYGPMTGRGFGYCRVPHGIGFRGPGPAWRRGRRGRFGGYGQGFGWGYPAYAEGLSVDDERRMLQDYIERLKEELGAVEERLNVISEDRE